MPYSNRRTVQAESIGPLNPDIDEFSYEFIVAFTCPP